MDTQGGAMASVSTSAGATMTQTLLATIGISRLAAALLICGATLLWLHWRSRSSSTAAAFRTELRSYANVSKALFSKANGLVGAGGDDGDSGGADEGDAAGEARSRSSSGGEGQRRGAIQIKWTEFTIESVKKVSPDTILLRALFPHKDDVAGLPPGRHISVRANIDGQMVVRPYTPVSLPSCCGYFELLVKVYDLGVMSSHLASLKAGDTLPVRGPIGNCRYDNTMHRKVVLVGAGSGLTPLLQLARCILADPDDDTEIELLYQNRTETDILLREVLDDIAGDHADSGRVTVRYFLSREVPPAAGAAAGGARRRGARGPSARGGANGWHDPEAVPARHAGYIDADTLGVALASSDKTFLCGPPGFNRFVLGMVEDAGVPEDAVHVF